MGFSDSNSDDGDAAMSGYVRPSKKKTRRNFKRRTVTSSDDGAAVVDGEGVTPVDRDERDVGFADERNTSPFRSLFGGRDLAHISDHADEISSHRGGALQLYSKSHSSYGRRRVEVRSGDEPIPPFVGRNDNSVSGRHGGGVDVGLSGKGVKRLKVSHMFSFLKNGQSCLEGDGESSSSESADKEDYRTVSCTPTGERSEVVDGIADTALWRDKAVQAAYGSREESDRRLSRMQWTLTKAGGEVGLVQQDSINSFLKLWGILHMVGSKRWRGKDYDDMIRVMSLSVANAEFLEENAWRKPALCSGKEGVDVASYELKKGTFIAPSRRTIERILPSLLESVTVRLTYYLVPINARKTGGAKIMRETRKAKATASEKLDLERRKSGTDIPVHNEVEGMPAQVIGIAPVTGGRSDPIEVKNPVTGGAVAVTSLESLIKFDMLTPRIFRSIVQEAEKENTDPFSIHQIPAVAARRMQHNFSKRIDALAPIVANWETPSPRSGNFEEEDAVIEGRVKRTSVAVGDCVSVLTENAFDYSDDILFQECIETTQSSAGEGTIPVSVPNDFAYNAAAAKARSDSTTFEGRIAAVWMVQGSETWADVNETCTDAWERVDAVLDGILAGENVEVLKHNLRKEYRSVRLWCTPNEIMLMVMLSFASYGRKGDGVNRRGIAPTGRSNRREPTLPWSPLKAGDIVSLIRQCRICPVTCACGSVHNSVPRDAVYAIVVNRFWKDPSLPSTFVYVVKGITPALDAIRKASARGPGNFDNHNCPYGTSYDAAVCRSEVLRTSTSGSGSLGGTAHFMRRSCKVIAINEWGASSGNELRRDRHGYLEKHVRDECKAALPTIGRLGEKWGGLRYIMYRIVIYWDGFTQETTRGSSVEGVYMQLLNLSPEERRSASAIRVLSVGPPGSDVKDLCGIALGDLIRLMIGGIRCWTADGEEVIVLPDLVCGLADTPALTQALDTRGHTCRTPCTVCRYEVPSEAGKGLRKGGKKGAAAKARVSHRYASQGTHSGLNCARRTAVNHQAIREACPPDEELLAIGLQVLGNVGNRVSSRTTNDDEDSDVEEYGVAEGDEGEYLASGLDSLPFHLFRQQYESARDNDELPRNADGVCLYPGTFCPYTALFPGVEHLLVGLFKGAMKFVLRLMTNQDRVDVNTYLTNYMQACGLPVQSQFVNLDSSIGLNVMSMSQSYCVSLFAERSLIAVSKNLKRKAAVSVVEKKKDLAIPSAINLVKLISDIISLAWVKEDKTWDKYGSTYVPLMQEKIRAYVSAVAVVCKDGTPRSSAQLSTVPDEDSETVRPAGVGRRNGRRRISNAGKSVKGQAFDPSEIARTTTDTPNVHKLTEIGATLLGNVGHLAKIAELAFEVRHGPIKSSISRSSGTDTQIAAMASASFADWSGRIAMTYEGALHNDPGSVLAMVRFLFGEDEYLSSVRNGVSSVMQQKVRNVIGPTTFNPTFLKEHGVTMLGGGHQDASLKVWAAELNYSRLLRDSAKRRTVVPDLVAEEVERLWNKSVTVSVAADGQHGIEGLRSLVWVGSLRRQSLSSLPATKRLPQGGALHHFLGTVVVGSVIRVAEKCLMRLSSTWKIPSVEIRPERQMCLPSFGKDCTFWCVIGLFQIGSTVQLPVGMEGKNISSGEVCLALREKSIGMLLAPCCYSDGYGVRPTLGTMDYSRTMQVSSDALKCVRDSDERLSGAVVLNAEANDDTVVPVAVLTRCEEVVEGGCCQVVEEDPADATSARVVRHGRNCGVLNGGKFLIRDCFSGYPPRSA